LVLRPQLVQPGLEFATLLVPVRPTLDLCDLRHQPPDTFDVSIRQIVTKVYDPPASPIGTAVRPTAQAIKVGLDCLALSYFGLRFAPCICDIAVGVSHAPPSKPMSCGWVQPRSFLNQPLP
jgi:hypothetical protein